MRNHAASPRNARNATTSVTVVRNTPDATAGSIPVFDSPIGIAAPASPATTMVTIIAIAMTTPMEISPDHAQAMTPNRPAKSIPLKTPTKISLESTRQALALVNSFIANARTATVSVCVPALPPIDAAMGIRTARMTICWMVASKRPITADASSAVRRFRKEPGETGSAGRDDGVVKIVFPYAAEAHDILLGLLLDNVEDIVDHDHADQPVGRIDHGRGHEVLLSEHVRDLLLIHLQRDGKRLNFHNVSDQNRALRSQQPIKR